MLEVLRRAPEHEHVAFAQPRAGIGLAADDAFATQRGDDDVQAVEAEFADGASDRRGAGRQHDRAQLLAHRVVVLERPGLAAAEDAAQDRIPVVADVLGGLEDLARGHVQEQQHVRDQRQAGLEDLRDHLGRASRLQRIELRVVFGAHQHRHVAAQLAHGPHDLERGLRAVERDDDDAGVIDAERTQHLGLRRVSVDHRIARLARIPDPERVEVECDVLEAVFFQHARQVLPDPPETADDHVLAACQFAGRRRLERDFRSHCGRAPQDQVRDAAVVTHDQRAEHHAERDRRQQRLHDAGVDHAALEQQREQREPEFAAHADDDAGAQRLARVGHELPGDQQDDQRLGHEQRGEQQQHQRQLPEQQPQVEQHADRDEEQPEQDVLEWLDHRLGLVAELGLREQHAGEEAAQRQREPERVGRPGTAQRDEQHGQRERLAAAVAGNLAEQGSQQPAAHEQHQQQRDDGAAHHAEQPRRAQDVLGGGERGGQREERREREILEQQDADRQPGMGSVDFELLAELAHDDRGRGHRERATDHDRNRGIDAEGPGRPADDRGREHHLQPAHAEHLGLHRDHPRQRELEAEREDQEHDADLGEQVHGPGVGSEPERMRPEQHPDHEVTEDRRQCEAAHQAQHDDGAREQDQDL